jgi:hypothetical protein
LNGTHIDEVEWLAGEGRESGVADLALELGERLVLLSFRIGMNRRELGESIVDCVGARRRGGEGSEGGGGEGG